MTKPTKESSRKAREDLILALHRVQQRVPMHDPVVAAAWAQIEQFCAISLRVMSRTNLSKILNETRNVEMVSRMAGRKIYCLD